MSTSLTRILSAMMPIPEQTLLLRASLLSGDACRNAWEAWKHIAGDAKQAMADDRGSVKRLLPALYVALRDNDANVDAALAPYLKLAYVREQMRSRTYYRICSEVLGALTEANIPFVMLRGGALAATVYPDAAIRHCHDIALFVRDEDVARARNAIVETGRTIMPGDPSNGAAAAMLRDETTLPIELYTNLLNTSYYQFSWDTVYPRTRDAIIGGVATKTLSAGDALLHVCAHASYSEARWSMRWVADAWHLIRTGNIDWNPLCDSAELARVELPLFVAFTYLVQELDADIPAHVLTRLESRANNAPGIARDIALRGVRAGDNASLRVLFERMPGSFNLRLKAVYWLLFPSRAYVQNVVGINGPAAVAAHYVQRPLGYLKRLF